MIIQKVKRAFFKNLQGKNDPYKLPEHVKEVERWVERILKEYPKADKEVVMLGVWFHDISYYSGDIKVDHAIKSEKMARQILLKENYNRTKIDYVCHVVRAHRNKDVKPITIEAKILACADSASHMTWITYMDMLTRNDIKKVYEKIERDWRDVGLIPRVKDELKDLHHAWLVLIKSYEKINLKR